MEEDKRIGIQQMVPSSEGRGGNKLLQKGIGESRWRRIIRFRLGNEIREGKYWEEEEKRRCRICEIRRET